MAEKTDRLVTLFGGGGFVGRYLAQALLTRGFRIRVAQRNPHRAHFLKPLASLGQVQFVAADIRDEERVARVAEGSEAVVNLVGVLRGNFQAIHHIGARNVARASAAAGARALVQVSAIGADCDSPSRYGKSKGDGEKAIREAFPTATIVRPSLIFGMEDRFVNRFAAMARMLPVIPVLRPRMKMQPVYVADVARAIALAAADPRSHGGRTYELGGPEVLTMRAFNEWIAEATGRGHKAVVDVPDFAAGLMARAGGWLPGAPITWDQWLMLQTDNVVSDGATGVEAFGISPAPLAAIAEGWLTAYRRSGRFAAKSPY